ncbi:hypothetical protein [Spirosoma montaniterrae]|uniref:Peptidase M50 n=1 Tax=Spirosoma montaniterrae TaxID=1178516 RepID=A0A1P9WU80_9BACT|nr:hypothetical protein [Spirosoma montaniterrae]AQG78946.1 hypothetical protein AWR27_06160 [Spirosoma montaniterrae]
MQSFNAFEPGLLIPQLSADVEFYPFDSNTYLVKHGLLGHQLRVSKAIMQVLELVDGERPIQTIATQMSVQLKSAVSSQLVFDMLYKGRLSQCGIVLSEQTVASKKADAYIWAKIILLKAHQIDKLCDWLAPLFRPKFFYALFMLLLVYLLTLILSQSIDIAKFAHWKFGPSMALYFYGIFILSTLLHEIGHAAACRHFNVRHGHIGLGMYLLAPVFFADVSDAWRVSKYKRLVIDLAGIFMELLFYSLISVVYFCIDNQLVLQLILLRLIGTTANLNPFLRFDGYWALCDLTNEPNLRTKSNALFQQTLTWLFSSTKSPLKTTRDYLMVTYASVSWFVIIFFIASSLLYNSGAIMYAPHHLVRLIERIIQNWDTITITSIWQSITQLLLPLLFYYMLIRLLTPLVIRFWKRLQHRKLHYMRTRY